MTFRITSLRKTLYILSQNSHTPIPYYAGQKLFSIGEWLRVNNEVIREQNER